MEIYLLHIFIINYCGIIKIRVGQFSWIVHFLQVRGDVISWISWLGRGGVKGKITPEKLILFEKSYLSLQWTEIASQVDLKMSTVKPLHVNLAFNTHNFIPQRPERIRSGFRKGG